MLSPEYYKTQTHMSEKQVASILDEIRDSGSKNVTLNVANEPTVAPTFKFAVERLKENDSEQIFLNIINKETLEYFPTGAIITNSARGDMIDDEAMLDALDRRKIYAVGLDVYKGEPNLNSGYLKHKSAFILPHLGSSTKETRTAMGNLAVDNIEEFFKIGNCKNKVN